jgi:hypothetical protein
VRIRRRVRNIVFARVTEHVCRPAPVARPLQPVGEGLVALTRTDCRAAPHQLLQREGPGPRTRIEDHDLTHVRPLHTDDEVGVGDDGGVELAAAMLREVETEGPRRVDRA